MKTIQMKEEVLQKPPRKDRKKEIIAYFKANPNKFIILSEICRKLRYSVSGAITSILRSLEDDGFLKSIKCPCGHGVLYYYGKKPKI